MAEKKYLLVGWRRWSGVLPRMRTEEVANHCGVHPDLIDRFVRLGLLDFVDTDEDGEALFGDEAVPTIRKILRLRNELGVNYAGIGVILDLMARIESLEARLAEMREKLAG